MIYVDDARIPATVGLYESKWSHLMAFPPDRDELIAFGKKIGLKPEWMQKDNNNILRHFDITDRMRNVAIARGATEITARELAIKVNECIKNNQP